MITLGAPFAVTVEDPHQLARLHRQAGYGAAYCPRIPLNDSARIASLRQAFTDEGIVLAEVGAWGNMLAADPVKRRKNLQRAMDGLALADEVGALCCVNYLGTFDPNSDYGPHPENLGPRGVDAAVQTVRTVIDAVKPKRAKFCLEMMQWVLPDSVQSYLDLLAAVDRPAFAVHLDPVNLVVSPRIYFDTGSLIRDCFRRLGSKLVSCHAKDLILRGDLALHLDEVRPGLGGLDYRVYLQKLIALPRQVPLMLEHLASHEEYALARDHLRGVEAELH